MTDHYEVRITFDFKPANRYGDELPGGTLVVTKKLSARTLTDLGAILGKVDELR